MRENTDMEYSNKRDPFLQANVHSHVNRELRDLAKG